MPENKHDIDLDGWDLIRAVEESRVDIVRLLIEQGVDVNATDEFDEGPLHSAVNTGNLDIARLLLDHDADVDAESSSGFTPLNYAVDNSLDVARLLIERGANTDVIDLRWMDGQEDA